MLTTARCVVMAALVLASGGLGSCYRMQYVTDTPPATSSPNQSEWNHFFIGGLIGDPEVGVDEMCPGGVSRVDVVHSVANIIVAVLTLGIYAPTTVDVWCADDGGAARPGDYRIEDSHTGDRE